MIPFLERAFGGVAQGHVSLSYAAKRPLQKWNHLLRTEQMQIRLNAWNQLPRTRSPVTFHRDVPHIPERISHRSLRVAGNVFPNLVNRSRASIDRPLEGRV